MGSVSSQRGRTYTEVARGQRKAGPTRVAPVRAVNVTSSTIVEQFACADLGTQGPTTVVLPCSSTAST